MGHLLDPATFLATVLYAGLGVAIFLAAFWLMTKLAPFSVRKEIEEDQNVALAILMGAALLGLAVIIAASLTG